MKKILVVLWKLPHVNLKGFVNIFMKLPASKNIHVYKIDIDKDIENGKLWKIRFV